MKKPKIIIISLIIIIAVVALAMSMSGKKKEPERIVKNKGPYNSKGFEVLENDTIIGWMLREKTVECKIETKDGAVTMKVKDGKIRVDGLPYVDASGPQLGSSGVDLTDGQLVYHWDSATKKGVKITGLNLDPNATSSPAVKTEVQKSWLDRANAFEDAGDKYDCAETNLSDDLFETPKDIVFTEITQ